VPVVCFTAGPIVRIPRVSFYFLKRRGHSFISASREGSSCSITQVALAFEAALLVDAPLRARPGLGTFVHVWINYA